MILEETRRPDYKMIHHTSARRCYLGARKFERDMVTARKARARSVTVRTMAMLNSTTNELKNSPGLARTKYR